MGATLTLPVQVVTGDAVPVRLDAVVDKDGKKLALKTELKPVTNLKAVQREWVTIYVDGKAVYNMSVKIKVQNRKIKQVTHKAVVTDKSYLEMPLPVNGKFPVDDLSNFQVLSTDFCMDEVAKKGSLVHAFQPMTYSPKYPVVETLTEKIIMANAQALNKGKKNSSMLMKAHTAGSLATVKSKSMVVTEESDDVSMASSPTEDTKSISEDSVSHAAIPDAVIEQAPTTTTPKADVTLNMLKIAVAVEFLIILMLAGVIIHQWNHISSKTRHTDL